MKKLFILVFLIMAAASNAQQWQSCNSSSCMGIPRCFIETSGIMLVSGNCMSPDSGYTWTQPASFVPAFCYAQHSTGIFAGTDSEILFSNNNGSSWTTVYTTGALNFVWNIAVLHDTIFAATRASGILMSPDNGLNWITVNAGLPTDSIYSIAVKDNQLFAGLYSHGICKSSDSGISWYPAGNGLPPITYVPSIATDGASLYAATGNAVYISNNDGATWQPSSLSGVNISKIISFGNVLLAGGFTYTGAEGVYRSLDNGINWSLFNNGLPAGCPYGVAALYATGNYVYCGMESQCGDIYRIPVSEVAVAISETGSAGAAGYQIYPNPFSQKLAVSTTSPFESEIILLDVTSRKILEHFFTNTSDLETDNLSPGIYLFLVKDKTGIIGAGKVVKN